MYKEFKTEVEQELSDWLSQKQIEFENKYKQKLAQDIISQVKGIALGDAKRIRPFVSYLMYREVSDKNTNDYSPFLAIELFHLFGLIHDDIMDRDDLRRNQATVHKFAEQNYFSKSDDKTHIGNSIAILAGDLVYSWVHKLLFTADGFDQQTKADALDLFFDMSEEVMVGQIMDMDTRPGKDDSFLEKKMQLKTSSYTFTRPMQIGLALGGGNEDKYDFCEKWGKHMGSAFQIQDDLIDFTSDESGKDSFSDIKEGNMNVLTFYIQKNNPDKFQKVLKPKLGIEKITDQDKKELQELFHSSGAFDFAQDEVDKHLSESKYLIDEYDFSDKIKKELFSLISLLENRSK